MRVWYLKRESEMAIYSSTSWVDSLIPKMTAKDDETEDGNLKQAVYLYRVDRVTRAGLFLVQALCTLSVASNVVLG